MRLRVKAALTSAEAKNNILIQGWVRTKREAKEFAFLEVNDGSCLKNLQVVVDVSPATADSIRRATTGASVRIEGDLIPSPAKGQQWELRATRLTIVGEANETYPLQKKGHSLEFLREIAHLRPRTNLFGCVFRLRSEMTYAIHSFYHQRGFAQVHTPIITASDCEGAGEMFRVTTQARTAAQTAADDFFGRDSFLTVSGQLEGETFACALDRIYTFGPTFRAENSNTARHAAEFWMIEPEMSFCDLEADMDLAEEKLRFLVDHALEHCADELEFFNQFVDKSLLQQLSKIKETQFTRLSYTEAVGILQKFGQPFAFPVEYGLNLQAEHEQYLAERHVQGPVIVHDYPKEIKPFYMRANDDGRTVAAMDVLVPRIGEIIGGSQREERLPVLLENMAHHGLSVEAYWWYVDLRRFGSVPHAGFGLGFERLLMLLSGVANIRDVIPFARTPGHADF